MDDNVWKIVGGIAGIGGIALAAIVYIFREVIRIQKVFTPVTRKHTYQLLNKIITYTFIIGILGIIAYIIISLYSGSANPHLIEQTPSPTPVISNNTGDAQRPSPTPLESGSIGKVQTPIPNQTTSNVNSEVHINEAPSPTPITFLLSSRVFDEDRNPISGARVSIVDLPELSVETKSNGTFVLGGIPKKLNERVKIRVESSGYITQEFDVVIGRPLQPFYLERMK